MLRTPRKTLIDLFSRRAEDYRNKAELTSRADVKAHCLEMARRYEDKVEEIRNAKTN